MLDTDPNDPNAPDNLYDFNDSAISQYVTGDGTGEDSGNDRGGDTTGGLGAPFDMNGPVGAAVAGMDNGDSGTGTGRKNVPNPGDGVVGISGYGDAATALPAEARAFQSDFPNGGGFANPNPIDAARFNTGDTMGVATAQGPSLGNGRPLTVEEQYFQDKYPNGGQFNAQGQPIGGGTPNIPNPGLDYTQPRGNPFMAADKGWAIDSQGHFSSTNTPDWVRANQGWQGGYVGQDTLVPGGATNLSYGGRFGTYGTGTGANGRPIDTTGFGPQQMQGGLYGAYEAAGGQGGLVPIGPGVNMGGKATGYGPETPRQQMMYNAELGPAPLGGGGVNGPGLVFYDPQTGRPVSTGGGGGYGGSVGAGPAGQTTHAAAAAAYGNPGAAAGGASGGALPDSQRIVTDASGKIIAVRDPDGYMAPMFRDPNGNPANYSTYNEILHNAIFDPGAREKLQLLARNGDAAAATVLSGIPKDAYQSQSAAAAFQQHNADVMANLHGLGNRNQLINAPGNPLPDSQVFAPEYALMDIMRASGVQVAPNLVNGNIAYIDTNGKTQYIPAWEAGQRLAQYNADNASKTSGGGGSGSRGYSPRGGGYSSRGGASGGGGGNAAAAAPAGFPSNPGVSDQNPIGSSAATDALAAQRIAAFGDMIRANGGNPRSVPRDVASAVGYMPGIMPGGNSPYAY